MKIHLLELKKKSQKKLPRLKKMAAVSPKELGRSGEQLAAEFLIKKGYKLITANLSFKQGEIDLLMSFEDTLVLVEVKTQQSADFSDPILKIDYAKQRKLRLLSRIIASQYPDSNIQIDAVTLYWSSNNPEAAPIITHYPNILT